MPKEKVNYKKLVNGIQKVIERGDYPLFLKMMKKFHSYSFRNSFLIYSQKPNATLVKGFVGWNEFRERNKKTSKKNLYICTYEEKKK